MSHMKKKRKKIKERKDKGRKNKGKMKKEKKKKNNKSTSWPVHSCWLEDPSTACLAGTFHGERSPLMKIGFVRQVRELKIQRKKLGSALGDGEIRASPAVLIIAFVLAGKRCSTAVHIIRSGLVSGSKLVGSLNVFLKKFDRKG
jgi:hypothetical protein